MPSIGRRRPSQMVLARGKGARRRPLVRTRARHPCPCTIGEVRVRLRGMDSMLGSVCNEPFEIVCFRFERELPLLPVRDCFLARFLRDRGRLVRAARRRAAATTSLRAGFALTVRFDVHVAGLRGFARGVRLWLERVLTDELFVLYLLERLAVVVELLSAHLAMSIESVRGGTLVSYGMTE